MTQRETPLVNFIGIGAPRSGTTWLAQCLREHPQVRFSRSKEVDFFNEDRGLYRTDPCPYPRGLGWYARQFPPRKPGQVRGEFSVHYLFDTGTPARIHRLFPHAKLLVCLRHPTDMAYSLYWWTKEKFGLEDAARFEEAITRQPTYLARARYGEQLARYREFFAREQIHTILYEDIVARPAEVMRSLYTFLGIDPEIIPPSLKKQVNPAVRARFKPLMSLAWLPERLEAGGLASVVSVAQKLGLTRLGKFLLERVNTKAIAYPPMHPSVRARLTMQFHDDLTLLERLIDRDLRAWKVPVMESPTTRAAR